MKQGRSELALAGLRELRDALAHIYVRGAVPLKTDRRMTSGSLVLAADKDEKPHGGPSDRGQQKLESHSETMLTAPDIV